MKNKKRDLKKITRFRFNFIGVIIILFFTIISITLVKLIIFDKEYYVESLEKLTETIVYGNSSPRGRIYDRNYNLLVDNKVVPVIYYKKNSKITVKEEIKIAKKMLNHLDIDSSKLNTVNLKEYFIADNSKLAEEKITEEEWLKLKNRKLNYNDIYALQIDRITEDDLKIYNESDKKVAYLYYLMNKGYSYEEKIIKEENISDLEYAYIAENADSLNGFNVKYTWERVYLYDDIFKSILGNISSISKEDKEYYLDKGYSLNETIGVSYLEKQYEDILRGERSTYKVGSNNELILVSEGKRGKDIVLTIDIELQKEVERILSEEVLKTKSEPSTNYYNHTFVVIQEPNTGEILAMSGKQAVYKNGEYQIRDYTPEIITSPMTVGSVIKAASIMVGYNNNIIDIGEYMSDECIKLYSVPRKCSWTRLGRVDDVTALAQSSNVYQFRIAMKLANFNYSYGAKFTTDKKPFEIYRKNFNEFGLGVKTEIDLPIESVGNIGKNTSADLLLNFAIGQYDTYTTMQLSQYMTTIASNGKRLQPHLLKEVYKSSDNNELSKIEYKVEPKILNEITATTEYIKRVQEGLAGVVSYGTGKGIMGDAPSPAGKTGTSESFLDITGDGVIDVPTLSNTFAGYAPNENPVMSITVTSPDLINPNSSTEARSYANHRITKLISNKFFELYNYTG